jgi:hypothetical protein
MADGSCKGRWISVHAEGESGHTSIMLSSKRAEERVEISCSKTGTRFRRRHRASGPGGGKASYNNSLTDTTRFRSTDSTHAITVARLLRLSRPV